MAVESASKAFQAWSSTTKEFKSQILHKIASLIESRLEEFAAAESQDNGKPLWLSRTLDIPRAIHNFRFFAGVILYQKEECTQLDAQGAFNFVQKTPAGVAALISPWNLPLYLLTWKIAPALACMFFFS